MESKRVSWVQRAGVGGALEVKEEKEPRPETVNWRVAGRKERQGNSRTRAGSLSGAQPGGIG